MNGRTRESEVVSAVAAVLRRWGLPHFRNNTGAAKAEYKGKARFIRYGAVGWPDFIAVGPGGKLLGIEAKRPLGPRGGKAGSEPSPEQVAVGLAIEKQGGIYLIVRSGADLDQWLAERMKA